MTRDARQFQQHFSFSKLVAYTFCLKPTMPIFVKNFPAWQRLEMRFRI
jgi:hypothetical protein